jgi:hydrogenase maturation protease
MTQRKRVLILGYGNPGRLDDGLGGAVADAVMAWNLSDVTVSNDLQLQVEDATEIAAHDVVIFADAHVSCAPPFCFERLTPKEDGTFSTHSVSARGLLALAQEYFDAEAEAYALGIRGYEFNAFEDRLSVGAQENLEAALRFLRPVLDSQDFAGAQTGTRSSDHEAALR